MICTSVNLSCVTKIRKHGIDGVDAHRSLCIEQDLGVRVKYVKPLGSLPWLREEQCVLFVSVWKIFNILLQDLSRVEVLVDVEERNDARVSVIFSASVVFILFADDLKIIILQATPHSSLDLTADKARNVGHPVHNKCIVTLFS